VLLREFPGADPLRELPAMDLSALAASANGFSLLTQLTHVVARAVYWQRPFDAATDLVLSREAALFPAQVS
jgi:hypothetical protein